MIVICAGVVMNLLLAVLIFWGINLAQGKSVWDTTEIGYVVEESPAASAGFMAGDKVLGVNGKPVANWDDLRFQLYFDNVGRDLRVQLVRNGTEVELVVPHEAITEQKQIGEGMFGITPAHADIVVETVASGMPADKAGLKPGDVILTLAGTPVKYDRKVTEIVRSYAGKEMTIEWRRGAEFMHGVTTPTDKGLIGISFGLRYSGPVVKTRYSFFGAFPEALKNIANVTLLTYHGITQIITGKMSFSQSVAGPVRIAQMASQTAEMGLMTYLGFMAFLSVSLALLNILPFPALDGGHLMFLLYEGTFRREIPVKVKLFLQKAGFVLLLAFMAFAVYNDIINF
jgi:regulator of sigma E protease